MRERKKNKNKEENLLFQLPVPAIVSASNDVKVLSFFNSQTPHRIPPFHQKGFSYSPRHSHANLYLHIQQHKTHITGKQYVETKETMKEMKIKKNKTKGKT